MMGFIVLKFTKFRCQFDLSSASVLSEDNYVEITILECFTTIYVQQHIKTMIYKYNEVMILDGIHKFESLT